MMFALLFLIFAGVAAGLWFQGTWSNALALPSIILAAAIATNFFEPLAAFLEDNYAPAKYLYDFIVLWGIFTAFYATFRGLTDAFAEGWITFPFPVETSCRSVLAIINSWVLVCFTAFSLHLAPLNAVDPLGAWSTPMEGTFLGMSPDRQWAAFAHSRSRGALSRGSFDPQALNPEDVEANVQAFDSTGEFIYRARQRRIAYSKLESVITD